MSYYFNMIDQVERCMQRLCRYEGDEDFVQFMDKMEADGIPDSQWPEKLKTSLGPARHREFYSWLVGNRESNAARPDKVRKRILSLHADSFDDLKRLARYFALNKTSTLMLSWGLAMGRYRRTEFVLRPRAYLDALSELLWEKEAGARLAPSYIFGVEVKSLRYFRCSRDSGYEPASSTSSLAFRLPQPFFCLGELKRVDPSGHETYTGFVVALSLVDQSVWVVFNSRDIDARWSSAHESEEYWDDDRDDVPDYLPDLDPAWAELAVPGEKWAAAKVADSLRSWDLGDPCAPLNFFHPVSLASGVVSDLVPVAKGDRGLQSMKA
ncbi:MAG: hypothetical protein M1826_007545 [Phylliscum demangeonii]|nr:MAG: hypothetical protein M1826_007545 [Phylliscum demangeonii]